jgi:hypothetical protein
MNTFSLSLANITILSLLLFSKCSATYTGAKKCMGFSKLPISKWKAISMR